MHEPSEFTIYQTTFPFSYEAKRITHKLGWMGILVTNEEYELTFTGSPFVTNITYDAKAYDLAVCTCCVYLFSFVILAPLVVCLRLFYSIAKSREWYICSATCSIFFSLCFNFNCSSLSDFSFSAWRLICASCNALSVSAFFLHHVLLAEFCIVQS